MQAPAAPGTGEKLELKEHLGNLLYITAHEWVDNIDTQFGPASAVRADVALLDGPRKGDVINDVLIFPTVLRNQLRNVVGNDDPNVVARLGQGDAKPGKSAPWILDPPSPADIEVAQKYEVYKASQSTPAPSPVTNNDAGF